MMEEQTVKADHLKPFFRIVHRTGGGSTAIFWQPNSQAAKWGSRFRSALESFLKKTLKDRTQSKFWTPPIFCCNKISRKIAHSLCKTASKLCLLAEGQGAGKGEEDNTIDQQFGQSTKEPLHFRSI